MEPINLTELTKFQKAVEKCFMERGIIPSFSLGNNYSLNFAYQKNLDSQYKELYERLYEKWSNFISFLLIVFKNDNPNTLKYLISLYNSIENAFLLISFLRLSGSYAIIRGAYENILKILFALKQDTSFDYEKGSLLNMRDLCKKLNNPLPDAQFVIELFDSYGQLCEHSHINIIQPEQILQEDFIEKLIEEAVKGLHIHNNALDLCISYLLRLFPETFYKFNSMTYAGTDLIRRVDDKFYCGFAPRFFFIKYMREEELKSIIDTVQLSPQSTLDKYSLAEVYLMLGYKKEAHELLKALTETQYFQNNPGCFIIFMLTSKLTADEKTYKTSLVRLKSLQLNSDYINQYTEDYLSKYSCELETIISDLLIRV